MYHYYEVWVSSPKYHGESALTYRYDSFLEHGSIVIVPMQRQTVVAVVLRKVAAPSFKTKSIIRAVGSSAIPSQLLNLIDWLRDYYPAPLGQLVSLLLPSSLTAQSRQKNDILPDGNRPQALDSLTPEQHQAVVSIHQSKSILLHGNTGTGKSRVYLEIIKDTLKQGRSAILLTPEIGLTPQLAIACQAAFPGKSIVVHSDLSPSQRREVWLRILESPEPLIVIGARSALFSPLKNIGVIVVDEFHEPTYKQEQAPHYQSARVAAKLAALHEAKLILGSATPPVTDYFTFQQKKLPIVRMVSPAISSISTDPPTTVIDLKNRDLFHSSPWLSDALIQAIEQASNKRQQSLVFLNRRGTARMVLCQVCGWQALCPRCDLSLTYHGDIHRMQCHTCGYVEKTPVSCPVCSSNNIIFRIIGTKSLVAELERLFPNAIIKRFDSDTKKSERLEQQYEAIRSGQVDILVGTQMLGKGLDLPKLSVLGVVLADASLTFPDYTSEERTFQLLTQVLGRVNRGHVPGRVYIQTYHPDSALLKTAVRQDYARFLALQLAERKQYGFPPFRFVLKLMCARARRATAQQVSEKLAKDLRNSGLPIEVIGPSPRFLEKAQDRYRWQIIVKTPRRPVLNTIIQNLPANWSYDIDPINLL